MLSALIKHLALLLFLVIINENKLNYKFLIDNNVRYNEYNDILYSQNKNFCVIIYIFVNIYIFHTF